MWVKYRQRHRFRQDVMGAGKVVGRLDLRWVLKVEIAATGCGEALEMAGTGARMMTISFRTFKILNRVSLLLVQKIRLKMFCQYQMKELFK